MKTKYEESCEIASAGVVGGVLAGSTALLVVVFWKGAAVSLVVGLGCAGLGAVAGAFAWAAKIVWDKPEDGK